MLPGRVIRMGLGRCKCKAAAQPQTQRSELIIAIFRRFTKVITSGRSAGFMAWRITTCLIVCLRLCRFWCGTIPGGVIVTGTGLGPIFLTTARKSSGSLRTIPSVAQARCKPAATLTPRLEVVTSCATTISRTLRRTHMAPRAESSVAAVCMNPTTIPLTGQ